MKLKIYTDGSFDKRNPNTTKGGFIILTENDDVLLAQEIEVQRKSVTDMHNVGAELMSAMLGIYKACELLMRYQKVNPECTEGTVVIYHDYKGVELFIQGRPRWVASKPGSILYVTGVEEITSKFVKVKLEFVKVKAHSGVKWNEAADSLASGIVLPELKGKTLPKVGIY